MPTYLVHRGRHLRLDEPLVVLGRERSCGHAFPADEGVSRRHLALVEAAGKTWWLLDLRSSNGTKLNGHRVEMSRLRDGDRIELGAVSLVFRSVPGAMEGATEALREEAATSLDELLGRVLDRPMAELAGPRSWGALESAEALARLARAQLEIMGEPDPARVPAVAAKVLRAAFAADRVVVALGPADGPLLEVARLEAGDAENAHVAYDPKLAELAHRTGVPQLVHHPGGDTENPDAVCQLIRAQTSELAAPIRHGRVGLGAMVVQTRLFGVRLATGDLGLADALGRTLGAVLARPAPKSPGKPGKRIRPRRGR